MPHNGVALNLRRSPQVVADNLQGRRQPARAHSSRPPRARVEGAEPGTGEANSPSGSGASYAASRGAASEIAADLVTAVGRNDFAQNSVFHRSFQRDPLAYVVVHHIDREVDFI